MNILASLSAYKAWALVFSYPSTPTIRARASLLLITFLPNGFNSLKNSVVEAILSFLSSITVLEVVKPAKSVACTLSDIPSEGTNVEYSKLPSLLNFIIFPLTET